MAYSFCISEKEALRKICLLPSAYGSTCIGSRCMAWRWVETHINNPDAPEGDLITSGDTHGYCGLAGEPWKRRESYATQRE